MVCGRVTDIALYLGPLVHEFGWSLDDWERLGMATVVAHAIECGGQATGGLYAGGWADVDGLETLGYPIAEVSEDGTAVLTKTPGSGGEVSIGTVSEQLVYEILDPGSYLTADVTADFTEVTLEEVGPDRVRITGGTGRERPATLKVNMGYRAGFVGEAQFTYTWPDAYAKAQRGLAFLRKRLERADFRVHRGHRRVPRSHLDVGVSGPAAGRPRPPRDRRPVRGALPGRDRGPQGVHRERAALQQRSGRRRRGRDTAAAQGAVRHLALPGTARARRAAGRDARTGYGGRAVRVADLAHGRSGDKGDTCNVGIVAWDDAGYATLREALTEERVAEHYGDLVKGSVTRYELPGIRALNFVLTGALDGGGTMSLRSDHLGKVMYAWLLRMELP